MTVLKEVFLAPQVSVTVTTVDKDRACITGCCVQCADYFVLHAISSAKWLQLNNRTFGHFNIMHDHNRT